MPGAGADLPEVPGAADLDQVPRADTVDGHAKLGEVLPGPGLLRQAQEIFQRIGAAETRDALAELDALSRLGPAR